MAASNKQLEAAGRASPSAAAQPMAALPAAVAAAMTPAALERELIVDGRTTDDWNAVAARLMQEMGVDNFDDLVPLLQGVLKHTIEVEYKSHNNAPARRCGAFSRVARNREDGDSPWEEEIWASMVRSVFARDAALALENRLLVAYTTEPFVSQLADLQASWAKRITPTSSMECSREVNDLCYDKVLRNVLPQFGMPPDTNLQEILRPYMGDATVAALNKEIQEALEVGIRQDLPLASLADYPNLVPVEACDLVDSALAANHAEGLSPMSFFSDSRVQSRVLAALGIGQKSILDQQPLPPEMLIETLNTGSTDLARVLMHRNAFKTSFLPLLSRLTASGMWPLTCCKSLEGCHDQIGELPTLELCAAVCIRILSVAQRLREAGGSQLLFLSVGAGCALVEASIALHLGRVLHQHVDLHQKPPLMFKYGKNFQILFVVSDAHGGVSKDKPNELSSVKTQMGVLPYEPLAAVRDFAEHRLPLFIFSCWPAEDPKWTANMEATAGRSLTELFVVRPPPLNAPDNVTRIRPISLKLRTTELYPKTFSCLDFVGHGFQHRPEVGLHHSHVYSYTPWDAPPPHLAEQITHTLDSFMARSKANRVLEGVDVFRRMGLTHTLTPQDLRAALPDDVVANLKEKLFSNPNGQKVEQMRRHLQNVLPYAEGRCKKMLEVLIFSTSRQQGVGSSPPDTRRVKEKPSATPRKAKQTQHVARE